MGVHKKGGLVGGFDQLRAPDAPTISVSAGEEQVTVTITNPSDVGGGSITGYAVSALTGPIEDTTFAVTVVSDGGNKYAIDGSTQATLTLYKGHTYIFDQSDSSNSSHPLRLSTTSNGSHGGGSEYTTGVTTSGTPGSAGAFTKIAIATDAPDTLYYYCTNHSGMGGTANLKTSLQGGASGSSSPITVSSLTNDETYNVRASAINAFGQSPYSAATSATPALLTRGLFAGGNTGSLSNTVDFIDISSTGDATDFGNLSSAAEFGGSLGSATRACTALGTTGSDTDTIDYFTIASTGDATDFGNLSLTRQRMVGASNSTRGIFCGGMTSDFTLKDRLDYITIASTGNATTFGNLIQDTRSQGGVASTTRAVFGGGTNFSGAIDIIQYVTIGSTGNSTDFGDLTVARTLLAGCSSSTRGIFGGGSSDTDTIDYITIASTGNATDFGNLLSAIHSLSACSSSTRGVFGGGDSTTDVIQYVTIGSTGNATDFGDLTAARRRLSACSNCHGGLS